jgi:hypothetical protein
MNARPRWLSAQVSTKLRRSRRLAVVFAAALTFVLALAVSGSALAAGSAKLKSNTVDEVGGAWRIHMTLELPKAPSIAHVPMRFVFNKTMVYERAQVDGSKDPVMNRVALKNQPPSTESMDVSFTNAMGKIWKGTSFDFSLPRDRGYEAGEYQLQVRTADGTEIGSAIHLTLKGDNPVVDRRSITFEAKKKGIEKVKDGTEDENKPKNEGDDTKFAMQSQEVAPSGTPPPFISKEGYEKTNEETLKERPKGCGCEIPGGLGGAGVGAPSAIAVALGLLFRRRRSRA